MKREVGHRAVGCMDYRAADWHTNTSGTARQEQRPAMPTRSETGQGSLIALHEGTSMWPHEKLLPPPVAGCEIARDLTCRKSSSLCDVLHQIVNL